MTRLVLGPFNRVEGDLEITLETADGHVAAARVTAPLYRGFEAMLVGRPPLDALAVAPRICGICSVAQSRAAAAALASAAELTPPPNGRLAADLVLAAESAADHLTHFALFFMPDFARPAYAGRPWHAEALRQFAAGRGEAVRLATTARLRLLHVVGILAGKWPHSLALQPGGTTKSVDLGERMRLLAILAEFRSYLETHLFAAPLERIAALDSAESLESWAAERSDGGLRLFLRIAEELELSRWGHGPDRFMSYGGPLARSGLWQSGVAAPLDLTGLEEDLSHAWMADATQPDLDRAGAYSWCKAPRLDGHAVEVGALARQLVAGHPLLRDLTARSGGRGDVRSRVVARLLELALLVPRMEAWVRGLGSDGAYCYPFTLPDRAVGTGLIEAARGGLGHWLTVEDGRIARYQIIAPTTWNFSPRDASGQPGPVEQALVGTPVEAGVAMPLLVQHVVRSFDPCMACTVH